LVLARPDVDPKRLAYVGHSYGAQWGSILSAVDKRMKTSVLMAGVAEMADILLRSDDPGMVDFRKSQPAGQLEKYAQVTGDIDAIHFVGRAAPIPLLLQFANYEQHFDKTSMQHYAAAASDPKKVLYYDTGHDLNDPQALEDRYRGPTRDLGSGSVVFCSGNGKMWASKMGKEHKCPSFASTASQCPSMATVPAPTRISTIHWASAGSRCTNGHLPHAPFNR
jgi:hypothetical protein